MREIHLNDIKKGYQVVCYDQYGADAYLVTKDPHYKDGLFGIEAKDFNGEVHFFGYSPEYPAYAPSFLLISQD